MLKKTPLSSPEGDTSKTNEAPSGAVGGVSIISAAQQMLDLLADYEQHPDEYHDGTYREPPEHLRSGYIDFYRAQAYMFMVESLTPDPKPHPLTPSPKGEGETCGEGEYILSTRRFG